MRGHRGAPRLPGGSYVLWWLAENRPPPGRDAVAQFFIASAELAAGGVATVFVGPPGAQEAGGRP